MARGVNNCQFIGHLGSDPETRDVNGTMVANFSIAVSETWKKDGQTQERTEWIRCQAWGKLAEICGQYLKKGSQVYVAGKMQTRKYEKDGQTHYATDINIREMNMLGGRGGAQSDTVPSQEFGGGGGFDDSDVPFMRASNL